MQPAFIVYAPRFDRNSGGTLVLYDLARRLRDKGYEVTIWVSDRPVFSGDYLRSIRWSIVRFVLRWLKYKRKRIELPHGLTETKRRESLRSIVIYPEVTTGNPLGIKNVVRWILYFPGVLSSSPAYGIDDLFFLFSKNFQNELVPQSAPVLALPLINLDSYHNFNFSERQGSLVLFRKGGHRDHSFHPPTAQCIDGKSHEELCVLFNKASRLYSYDPYTAYTVFAALCGCIPIVIPIDGVSEEQWLPDLCDRYGVAYGEDRVSFAVETRDLLLTELEKRECDADRGLENFLKVVLNNFFKDREIY